MIALVFGVPAGALGALTIQRSIQQGFLAGFITGLGSSAADLLYACAGVFGFTLIFDFLAAHRAIFQLAGGILIILIGVMTFRKEAVPAQREQPGGRLALYFLSSFSIAILNPLTIASFLLAFTAFGLDEVQSVADGAALLSGIFIGTVFWWVFISALSSFFRKRISGKIYRWLNIVLGALLIVFGAVVLARGMFE
jgi:threonine/homoserine/homoserine lactone efflux protein